MQSYSDAELRAIAASRKAATIAGGRWNQPGEVQTHTVDGLDYVVGANVNGILFVYRIQPNGRLKGLKRWPAEITTCFEVEA